MSGPEIITLGCRLNAAESEAMRALAAGQDDLVIVNSCAVTNEAVRQTRQAIRKAKRARPHARVLVTGCAAQVEPETFARMAEVDGVIGNREKMEADTFVIPAKAGIPLPSVEARGDPGFRQNDGPGPDSPSSEPPPPTPTTPTVRAERDKMEADTFVIPAKAGIPLPSTEARGDPDLRQDDGPGPDSPSSEPPPPTPTTRWGVEAHAKIRVSDIMAVRETAPHLAAGFAERARAFVEVQNGCDHRCTFCIIPFGRGNSRSVPAGLVVDRIKALVGEGHNEVVLTGVDVTSYGPDLPGAPSLGQLVERILRHVPDLPRLRLSSLDCIELDERLFDIAVGEPRFMPHLHMSFQAGDDLVLKRMKRRHSRAQAIETVARLKARRPDIAIGADLIAGFPTETDDAHANSLRLVEECDIVMGHIFPYSPKRGTPAARMPQVPAPLIKQRARALRQACAARKAAWMQNLVGTVQKVLVEREDGSGHAENFAPVTIRPDRPPRDSGDPASHFARRRGDRGVAESPEQRTGGAGRQAQETQASPRSLRPPRSPREQSDLNGPMGSTNATPDPRIRGNDARVGKVARVTITAVENSTLIGAPL